MTSVCLRLINEVVTPGLCTGCGACVALDPAGASRMADSDFGPQPCFADSTALPELAWTVCPGKGYALPELYRGHYGRLPENWLLGPFVAVRTGHASDPAVRRAGASGGVLTAVLLHLLETGRIDAAVVARQGVPTPERARAVVARTPDEIRAAAGSVYIPVAMLDRLPQLEPGGRYAITCLPDQAAALRLLQQAGHEPARRVRYVLGPYTGTALYPAAIRAFLRAKGVPPDDAIVSLQWRAGEWPGHLEIHTAAGRRIEEPKFYYNYLIPFFITQASLRSMDFTNEFCDLSAGDAWSPRFEARRGGFNVFTTRTAEMEDIIREMEARGRLVCQIEDPVRSLEMHGHMLDFKKRGGYIRNRTRRRRGRPAPAYGLRPAPLPASRRMVEAVIGALFGVCRTRPARALAARRPVPIIGRIFNILRKGWKAVSKPAKRKGLRHLVMVIE